MYASMLDDQVGFLYLPGEQEDDERMLLSRGHNRRATNLLNKDSKITVTFRKADG